MKGHKLKTHIYIYSVCVYVCAGIFHLPLNTQVLCAILQAALNANSTFKFSNTFNNKGVQIIAFMKQKSIEP